MVAVFSNTRYDALVSAVQSIQCDMPVNFTDEHQRKYALEVYGDPLGFVATVCDDNISKQRKGSRWFCHTKFTRNLIIGKYGLYEGSKKLIASSEVSALIRGCHEAWGHLGSRRLLLEV